MKIARYMAFPLITGFPSSIHYCKHTLCAAYKSYHNSSYKHYYEYEQKQKYFNGLTWASLGAGCLVLYWYYEKYKSLCASSQQGTANLLTPLFSITNCQDINNTSSKHDCLDKNAEIQINKKNKTKIYKHCISAALRAAINRSEERLLLHKEEYGIPGFSVAVYLNGSLLWSQGYGYSDVENSVKCTPHTVMRIASLSKPITSTAVALLSQQGKLDIDAPIQKYVKDFPIKSWDGTPVEVTIRQILCHQSGIRSYHKNEGKKDLEMFINKHYTTVTESLTLFKDDELICKPNTKYNYSTISWILVSAVVESITGTSFLEFLKSHIFQPHGLISIQGEYNDPLISHRSKYYCRINGSSLLRNTAYIDNSYKWAGGGLISNVLDVAKFGDIMLRFYQNASTHSFLADSYRLSHDTVKTFWTCQSDLFSTKYGECNALGWFVKALHSNSLSSSDQPTIHNISHSGSAIGASSHLYIRPHYDTGDLSNSKADSSGVVVAIISNLQNVSFSKLVRQLADDIYESAYC